LHPPKYRQVVNGARAADFSGKFKSRKRHASYAPSFTGSPIALSADASQQHAMLIFRSLFKPTMHSIDERHPV
jgi:hypothetical protein